MEANTMAGRVARIAGATLGAALLLFFLSALLADAQTQAAPRSGLGTDTDPAIEAVVLTGASKIQWHTLGDTTSRLPELGFEVMRGRGVRAVDAVGDVSALSDSIDFSVRVSSQPTVGFDSQFYSVGEGTEAATIIVTLDEASSDAVSVDYATTSGGSATEGVDYTPVAGTLVFGADVTRLAFTVDIIDDLRDEVDETVFLTLSGAAGATLGANNRATLTIVDDDYHVYLPLLRTDADLFEPNNTPGDAYGPLDSGGVYCAYIWDGADSDDYYHFTPTTDGEVRATLTNIPEHCYYDLYVYRHDGSQYVLVAYSNNPGNADESLTFSPTPDEKYFIRVYPYAGSSNQQCYHLRVDYR